MSLLDFKVPTSVLHANTAPTTLLKRRQVDRLVLLLPKSTPRETRQPKAALTCQRLSKQFRTLLSIPSYGGMRATGWLLPERAFYAVAAPPPALLLAYSQLVKAARRNRLRSGGATCALGAIQCPFRNATPTYSSAADAGCHLFGASSRREKPATTSSSAAPRYAPAFKSPTSVANARHQGALGPGSMVHSNMQMRALTLPDEPRLFGTSYCA